MSERQPIPVHLLFQDLTGQKFSMLEVLYFVGMTKGRNSRWRCRCDCGQECERTGPQLKDPERGACGCLRRAHAKKMGAAARTHGMTHTPVYQAWAMMIDRCHNANSQSYFRYGARGITVCARWRESFENFYADMGPRPSDKHSLDRFPDPHGNYEPWNCRWATRKQQQRNLRNNQLLTLNGVTKSASEWAEIKGWSRATIAARKYYGWSDERTLTEIPLSRRKSV